MIERVEFLVEEPSLEITLRLLIPKIIPGIDFEVFPFQGKDDMLRNLPNRLKGYAKFLPPTWRLVVLVDRDDDDCEHLKRTLEEHCRAAGLATRSRPRNNVYAVVNRILIEELEAWFFGDWRAVCLAYPKVDSNLRSKAAFRFSDDVRGGTWESLWRILQKYGYFRGRLRKVELASAVANKMDPGENDSPSFVCFRDALIDFAHENEFS